MGSENGGGGGGCWSDKRGEEKGGSHLMVAGETDLDIGDFKRGFSH